MVKIELEFSDKIIKKLSKGFLKFFKEHEWDIPKWSLEDVARELAIVSCQEYIHRFLNEQEPVGFPFEVWDMEAFSDQLESEGSIGKFVF